MDSTWISFEEVAKALKVSRPTATMLVTTGKVPGLEVHHGMRRINRKTFESWLLTKDR